MLDFFSLGEITISKVLPPLIPTSSSCLNFADGGYLCQPRSSSRDGAPMRSKLPRPEIVDVTVIGSPTCRFFGFASTVMAKWPTAPEKLAGELAGSGFISSATGSLFSKSFVGSPENAPKGSLRNGSSNGSRMPKTSNGERLRDLLEGGALRRTSAITAVSKGGNSILPA